MQKGQSFFAKNSEPAFFAPTRIQPKLTIGPVDDPYEREADAIADSVMRMSDAETLQTNPSPVSIQRKCGECEEEEEKIQPKCAHCEQEEKTQMKREAGASGGMTAPPVVHDVINSGGRPLDLNTRNFMESRFGHDFGNVQIHNDSLAHKSSADINALAYTYGNHVVFGVGQYQPNTHSGKQLLSHELTHVVQQSSDAEGIIQKKEKHSLTVSPAPCSQKSKASSYVPTTKDSMGKPILVSLGASEFGNTSKLAAFFQFGACKDKTSWRFYVDKLTVSIDSKIQPVDFKINVPSADDKSVTKDSYPKVIKDLKPARKVKMSVSCAGNNFQDEVISYSPRKEYWNRQFVIDHEDFHRKDWDEKYRPELIEAEKQVWGKSIPVSAASTVSDAIANANTDLTKYMIDAYQRTCKTFTSKKESRAYDNGAHQYQKLVDEIDTRAKKEKW